VSEEDSAPPDIVLEPDSTFPRKALIFGPVLVVFAIVARLFPRVVTGLSVFTFVQAAGILLVVYGVVKSRKGIKRWVKSTPAGKSVLAVGAIVFLLFLTEFSVSVRSEIEAGRVYDRVEIDLENEDPVAARSLSGHLSRLDDEYAPLKLRVIERIVEFSNSDRVIIDALHGAVRRDPDPRVRKAAAGALVTLMTPRDVVRTIEDLPELEAAARAATLDILVRRTEEDFGDDPAAWKRWAYDGFAGAGDEQAFRMALLKYRSATDPAVRESCLARLREGGADELLGILGDSDPVLRAVAATGMGEKGDAKRAGRLLAALRKESDPDAAIAIAAAAEKLDGAAALAGFTKVMVSAAPEAARSVAMDRLVSGLPGNAEREVGAILVARYAVAGQGEKPALLDEIVRRAARSDVALLELLRLCRDRKERARIRARGLRAVLEVVPDRLTDEDLVTLLEGDPDPDFGEAVRAELRRRTGRDGRRDPAAWRKLLE